MQIQEETGDRHNSPRFCVFQFISLFIFFYLEKSWATVSSKKNAGSMTTAVKSSFNNLEEFLPSSDVTEPTFNISDDTTKDEIVNITESVLTAIASDCLEDSCTYSENIKTSAMSSLETRWLEINSKKNSTSIKSVLETSFSDFEKLLPTPDFIARTGNITDNTTLDDLKAVVEEFWKDLNDECKDGNCGMEDSVKTSSISSLGSYKDYYYIQEEGLYIIRSTNYQLILHITQILDQNLIQKMLVPKNILVRKFLG